MSKIAEKKALEAYPDATLEECHGDIKMMNYCNNDNSSLREGYIKGYDQAMQDFSEKAKEFFIEQHAGMFTQFKNYMQNESEN